MKAKLKFIKVIIVVATVLIGLIGAAYYINPYKNTTSWNKIDMSLPYDQSLTKEDALSDLKYIVDLIKDRHVSSVTELPLGVSMQYTEEIEAMPENPTVLDVWRSGSRILKQLDDAHSAMSYASDNSNRINLDLRLTNNVLICTSGDYLGQEIESINGISISTLYETFLSQFSYENIYYAEYNFEKYLKRKHTLTWLGVPCSDTVEIVFNNNGILETAYYTFEEIPILDTNRPDFARYTIDKEKSVGVFTLDSCRFNDAYKNTLKQFFIEVKNENIKSVAIDLRNNGGGHSAVADEFIRYLPIDSYLNFGSKIRLKSWIINNKPATSKNTKYDDLLFNGDLYVLTSRATFSSATWFSVLIADNNLGKVIGDPSGNRPSAYGDILLFETPYSKIPFIVTYKQFTRPDIQKDLEEALFPDYPVDAGHALEELYTLTTQ